MTGEYMNAMMILQDISTGKYQPTREVLPLKIHGFDLPQEYLLLIDALGGGGSFYSESPTQCMEVCLINYLGKYGYERYASYSAGLQEYYDEYPQMIEIRPYISQRHPAHPILPGLFPWGGETNHLTFSWLINSQEVAVSIVSSNDEYETEFPMSLCQFLQNLLSRKLSIVDYYSEEVTSIWFQKRG
jgi:hypothetical protein